MVGAVEHRPRQRVEAGIDEQVFPRSLPLDRADLCDHRARLGREIAARLDLQSDAVAEPVF